MSVQSSLTGTKTINLIPNPEMPDVSALQKLRQTYHAELFNHLSVEKLYALPEYILDCGGRERDYNLFPFDKDMPNAVRGRLAETGRVFIAVRYVDESEETPTTKTDTLFQRYSMEKENWAVADGAASYIHRDGGMSSADFEYLARIMTGQPCGSRILARNEGSRTFRGTSIVHLGQAQQLQITP